MTVQGAPIQSVICYCTSCRTAARRFEREAGGAPVVRADGGVEYCLYRKGRVAIARGAAHLVAYRLTPDSPTRRVVARCCGAPMFADFTPGHWLTVFRDRLGDQAPAPQMRIMIADRPAGADLPHDIPAYAGRPPRLMMRLVAAWAAMGFRRPGVAGEGG